MAQSYRKISCLVTFQGLEAGVGFRTVVEIPWFRVGVV